ncbi:ABC transporter permease [Iamia sp. SCSIO 61187]|uniref:ABC transporter permease n=1 Tax=Iamia sp. SCSIO 61187 TaxID=2722752 RepID=UPI001C625A24|nr:ABC transporter permease [Iamia sp. SCSIO 61187]QYG93137.1 ABC transporter permease [Iamia sp. SCSIO 61187]
MRGPLAGVHLERRIDRPRWLTVAVPLASLVVALVIGAVVLAAAGKDPSATYDRILQRGFLADGALSATLVAASPLLFTGLAAAVAFRMGIFNIGGEGQLVVGAIGATWAGLTVGDGPVGVTVVAMLAAGALAGAAWAGIAAALRAWLRTNEIITTLMLNYVALNLATYLIFGSRSAWRELEGSGLMFPQGKSIPDRAEWPTFALGDVVLPLGFLVGAAVAVTLFVLLRSTRFGFEVRVIGDEPRAARLAGIRTRRVTFALLALSGAVAGLGGASDVGDTRHVLDPKALGQAGYGYAGIVVAALARLNPLAVVLVAILMGGLANAGRALQGPDFPAGLVGTLQGLLLVCTLAGELFSRYRLRRTPGLQVDDEPPAATEAATPAGAPS